MSGQPFSDDPIFEDEIVTPTTVVRATVDRTDDGEVFGMLATEPEHGPLRQHIASMEEDDWERLEGICRDARAAQRTAREGKAA